MDTDYANYINRTITYKTNCNYERLKFQPFNQHWQLRCIEMQLNLVIFGPPNTENRLTW